VITLEKWLEQVCPFPLNALHPMQGDASFRRYFRLMSGENSYVVMDASAERDCIMPYATIAAALQETGVLVPEIIAKDSEKGFMLISDLGNRLYLNELSTDNADRLYKMALDALSQFQTSQKVLPAFDQAFMQRELDEFNHWFLESYLKLSFNASEKKILQETFTLLTTSAAQQTQVFMHRDYHSGNLMVLPNSIGILDFQDACRGPITYDLVSLLRDCYIAWPDEKVRSWVWYFYEKQNPHVSFDEFLQWFDWMGMQRHMKALFIFARKYLRDGTPRYLTHIPRVLNYMVNVSGRYPEFQLFYGFLQEVILPCAA